MDDVLCPSPRQRSVEEPSALVSKPSKAVSRRRFGGAQSPAVRRSTGTPCSQDCSSLAHRRPSALVESPIVTGTVQSALGSPLVDDPPVGRRRRPVRSVGRSLWWFVLPAAAIYLFVIVVPSVQGGASSFTNWSFSNSPPTFIGFENYVKIFQGDAGGAALRTLYIAFVTVV